MAKYKAYPEYKKISSLWVNVIPSHWKYILFKRVVSGIKDGTHGTHARVELGYPLLSAKNVKNNGIEINEGESLISEREYREITSNGFPKKNDLLITCVGTIGRSCVYQFSEPVAFQRSVAFLRLSAHASPYFYKYYVESKPYQCQLEAASKASAQSGVYMGDLVNTLTVFPPINDQKSIVKFLNYEVEKIDHLIEKQQQLIELLKEKRQAVISHAVTKGLNPDVPMKDSGVEWLGAVPEHWVSSSLKYMAKVIDCKHITAEFSDVGIPVASISEVKSWFVDLSTAKLTNKKDYLSLIDGGRKPVCGDILYSRNATVGEAAIVSENMPDFAMGQDICLIKANEKAIPEFILYTLKSEVIAQQLNLAMVGSTFKRINVDDIRNFSIAIPSRNEQVLIVKMLMGKLEKYDRIISNAVDVITYMQERRTALISAAVTGKIDVRDWVAPDTQSIEEPQEATA